MFVSSLPSTARQHAVQLKALGREGVGGARGTTIARGCGGAEMIQGGGFGCGRYGGRGYAV